MAVTGSSSKKPLAVFGVDFAGAIPLELVESLEGGGDKLEPGPCGGTLGDPKLLLRGGGIAGDV